MVQESVALVKLLNEVLDLRKADPNKTDEEILKDLISANSFLLTKKGVHLIPKVDRALKMRRENKKTSKKQIIELIINESENK